MGQMLEKEQHKKHNDYLIQGLTGFSVGLRVGFNVGLRVGEIV